MVLTVNNHLKHVQLLTVEMFRQSITICIRDGYSLSKPLKFTIEMLTFPIYYDILEYFYVL